MFNKSTNDLNSVFGRQYNKELSFDQELYSPKKIAPVHITVDLYDTNTKEKKQLQQGSFNSKTLIDKMTGDHQRVVYEKKKLNNIKKLEDNRRLTAQALMETKAQVRSYQQQQNGDIVFKDESLRAQLNKKTRDANQREVLNQIKEKLERKEKLLQDKKQK